MGMAASQGRFLSLTARKSNTEYEGQQINQQRTILANQSASLNNRMLALSVPVPPDAAQYYNEKYVFTDGDKSLEVISGLGRSSTIVRETTTEYNLYSQWANQGNISTLILLNNKITMNNKELSMLNDSSSAIEIRNILDNGSSDADHPFKYMKEEYSYSKANETQLADKSVQKYRNAISKISLTDAGYEQLQKDFVNNIPCYYVTKNEDDKTVYTKLTDKNFEELVTKAKANDGHIATEVRDSNNQPIKTTVTQSECDNTEGLDFYVTEKEPKVWTKATDTSAENACYPAEATNKDTLLAISGIENFLEDGDIIVYKKTKSATSESGYTYERINSYENLQDLSSSDELLQLVDIEQGTASEVPTEKLIDTQALVGIPLDCIEEIENVQAYILTEKDKVVSSGISDLTQEMWNQAKAAGDEELMNSYIENLVFSTEESSEEIQEASTYNRLYYYTSTNTSSSTTSTPQVHYVQELYTTNLTEEGSTDQRYIREFYEHAYTAYNDKTYTNCVWYKDDSTGRWISLTATNEDGETKTYDLTYQNVKDDKAYEQAMMDYEYKKAQYEKAISDINAKTETIQQDDKTLELRLKSLDTEQQALSQELEAVKKVIDNDIEKSFDTFS